MNNLKIIRKLGNVESLYDNEVLNGNFILSRALKTKIPKEFEINLATVYKAVDIWIHKYPLLNSKIYRTQTHEILQPKYFVYLDHNIEHYKNIELIEADNERQWVDLIENELKAEFDHENGPLWRMKILKYSNSSPTHLSYDFVLTTSHAIGDGRNILAVAVRFLSILSALQTKTECDEMKNTEPDNNSAKTVDELYLEMKSNPNYKFSLIDVGFDAKTHRISNKIGNRINGVHGRYNNVLIESNKFERLLKKMKQNAPKCKVTCLLTVIFCMSMKKAYLKHNVDDIPIDSFQPCILVSIREKLGVKNTHMGVYSVGLDFRIDGELTEENMWKIAEAKTVELFKRIENNEDIHCLEYIGQIIESVNANYDYLNNQPLSFDFSNIGAFRNDENCVIKVVEHYSSMPSLENRFVSPMCNTISSFENNLCWGISYNEKFFRNEFINDLKLNIIELVDRII